MAYDADCASEPKRQAKRHIPLEIVFDILSHVPAQVLHNLMRHVCREWNLMIRHPNFVRQHLWNSTTGILIQDRFWPGERDIYVQMQRGCLEICEVGYELRHIVWSSCNGLVLAPDSRRPDKVLWVINPLTKWRLLLPPCLGRILIYKDFCLAFVESSKEYKVVNPLDNWTQIAVLTVGVDEAWRLIDVGHLCPATRVAFVSPPVVTGGYVHWIVPTHVLTLNVANETARRFPLPWPVFGDFHPMGGSLSVVFHCSWDVWEMNPETGEWIKLPSSDFRPKFVIDIRGWLAAREVLLCTSPMFPTRCVAYNLKTSEMQPIPLGESMDICHFQPHVNSLVWLEG